VFDHVTIRASDRAASEVFYGLVLKTVGLEQSVGGEHFTEWGDFSLAQATADEPVTRRLHVAFFAPTRAHVDEFWRTGTTAGYRDDGAPGPRPQYSAGYYGGFLLDPDGNSAEAVHNDRRRRPGAIDHVWLRVADLDAARRFYELVGPFAGVTRGWTHDGPPRVGFASEDDSFSIVDDGAPTEHVHIAFAAPDDATVDAFHRTLTGAGHPDNGAPGERLAYHEGYYGAFVLDPDGNNVELVNHNRG